MTDVSDIGHPSRIMQVLICSVLGKLTTNSAQLLQGLRGLVMGCEKFVDGNV